MSDITAAQARATAQAMLDADEAAFLATCVTSISVAAINGNFSCEIGSDEQNPKLEQLLTARQFTYSYVDKVYTVGWS